jgi:hypothetical protein
LKGDRAFDGIDDAGELDQRTVAHFLDDSPTMAGDRRIETLGPDSAQRSQCPDFVGADQP